MNQESFLSLRRFRYLKWSIGVVLLSILLYIIDRPPIKANGGTWLGYGLGTAGALLILWLLAFGVRKRAYSSTMGTVRGWLSAHVYLGLALAVVTTLHTGFSFGWNVHTLAYVLVMLVIISGLLGVAMYIRHPSLMSTVLHGLTLQEHGQVLHEIDVESRRLAQQADPEIAALVEKSAKGLIYSSAWHRLRGIEPACATLAAVRELEARHADSDANLRAIYVLQYRRSRQLLLIRDYLRLKTLTDAWLDVHVPLSFGLLAVLSAHIVSVFYYW
jgi:uncharacterized membrane protein (UPF0136 family)